MRSGDDVDASALLVKHDFAVDQGEQGVIVTLSDAPSRTPFGAALTNEDVSGGDRFATKLLDAATLCVGIPAVAARTLSFLMCHLYT